MKAITLLLLSFCLPALSFAQTNTFDYEASPEHPFGQPNPEAPEQIGDWAPLIGECDCKSVSRNPDQSWAEPVDMVWRFKYIMNGNAVQDETIKADGLHSGSIRQYNADSSRWYVHYYSNSVVSPNLSAWEGNLTEDGQIILYKPQTAPNGMEGFYKITFYEISEQGFKWLGEWVSPDESFKFPAWKIECEKRE
ncbi:MAG: hypothetical protein AAF927_30225 [Bacteroidota bacterium]